MKELLPGYEIGVRFTASERFDVRATKAGETVKFVGLNSVTRKLNDLARDIRDQMELGSSRDAVVQPAISTRE